MKKRNSGLIITENKVLQGAIAPLALEFDSTRFYLSDYICKCYEVISYPPVQDYGWCERINNIAGTVVTFNSLPINGQELIDTLANAVRQDDIAVSNTKDELERIRKTKAAADGRRIIEEIDQNNETVASFNCTVMVYGVDEQDFIEKCNKVESIFNSVGCKIRCVARLQQEAFKQLSPTFVPQDIISTIGNRIMPVQTFYGGYPFANSGFNDGGGYYLGHDSENTPVIFDLWHIEESRTNASMVVTGTAGTGKSTLLKLIILYELCRGTKIFVMDAESEFGELVRLFDAEEGFAKVVDASGGKSGRINPLQIRPRPIDEKEFLEGKEEEDIPNLALHLKTLEIFFSLYLPSLTQKNKAVLNKALLKLYNKFGIDWNTDTTKIPPEKYPIFTDLYKLLQEEKEIDKQYEKDYDELILLLENITNGADSFLWNGATTISDDAHLTVIDTHNMSKMTDEIKCTQYFNLLSWCWERVAADRTQRTIIVCDECWLLINPKVTQSIEFLRDTVKRSRKYKGGVIVATQTVVDFLDPAVKRFGQNVLDIPTYKFLFGTDGEDLQYIRNLYNLTEAQYDLLAGKQRGICLMRAGGRALKLYVDIPDDRLAMLGKRGGM